MKLLITLCLVSLSTSLYAQKYYSTFTWSPDSKQILFAIEDFKDDKSSFQLFVMNSDGTVVKRLVTGAWSPSWSPDGTKIVFAMKKGGEDDIYIADPDGGHAKQLTKNPAKDREPSFSRDGTQILFTSNRDGKPQIYKMNADGSGQEKLFSSSEACYSASGSPKEDLVVYYKDKGDHMDKVCVFDSNAREERLLTRDSLHNFYPSWTPDGQILFTSTKRSDSENSQTKLYSMSSQGRESKPVGNLPAWFARMSPDGKKIAYSKTDENGSQIYVARADGSSRVCITCK